jgi:hypothetical protein
MSKNLIAYACFFIMACFMAGLAVAGRIQSFLSFRVGAYIVPLSTLCGWFAGLVVIISFLVYYRKESKFESGGMFDNELGDKVKKSKFLFLGLLSAFILLLLFTPLSVLRLESNITYFE